MSSKHGKVSTTGYPRFLRLHKQQEGKLYGLRKPRWPKHTEPKHTHTALALNNYMPRLQQKSKQLTVMVNVQLQAELRHTTNKNSDTHVRIENTSDSCKIHSTSLNLWKKFPRSDTKSNRFQISDIEASVGRWQTMSVLCINIATEESGTVQQQI